MTDTFYYCALDENGITCPKQFECKRYVNRHGVLVAEDTSAKLYNICNEGNGYKLFMKLDKIEEKKLKKMKVKLNTLEDVREFVEITDKYPFDINVSYNNYVVDGKSLMGVLSIGLSKILVVEPQGFVDSNFSMKDRFYGEIEKWKVA